MSDIYPIFVQEVDTDSAMLVSRSLLDIIKDVLKDAGRRKIRVENNRGDKYPLDYFGFGNEI